MIAAAVIVLGSAMAGYLTADLHPYLADYGYERQLGALLGFVAGIVTAGIIFGPLAALYDIRDNVRRRAQASGWRDTRSAERGALHAPPHPGAARYGPCAICP